MGKGGKGTEASGEGEENMAAWLVAKNTLKIMPIKLPPLGPHDVRLRMKAVEICGSDVHYLREMRITHFVVKGPMVIGHECAGVIEEVGTGVKHLAVGDRVALEPSISCWRCRHCKSWRYNLCDDMRFFATPLVHGSLANQIVHPADLCFKLPDNVSLEEGAMCEPLSVGVQVCRRANHGRRPNRPGQPPRREGLRCAARGHRGHGRAPAVGGGVPRRGRDATVKVSSRAEDVASEVERIQAAMGVDIDVSLDCAGFDKTVSTWPGGRSCLVGLGHNEMTVPLTSAAIREVDIVGIFRYKDMLPLCIEFLRSGKVDVKPLIMHRFGFSQRDVEEAFKVSARGRDAIKVMFNL